MHQILIVCFASIAFFLSHCAHSATITSLGGIGTLATAVSGDGTTVVGTSSFAVFMHKNGVMTQIGNREDYFDIKPFDVSYDGRVIVGRFRPPGTLAGFVYQNGQINKIAPISNDVTVDYYIATGVSGDGQLVVGTWGFGSFAFQNTAAMGVDYFGGITIQAVSGDGSTLVGNDASREALLYKDGNYIRLGQFPGGRVGSTAYDVSQDGSVAVGYGTSQIGIVPFVYKNGEMIWLDYLSDLPFGRALGVSANGKKFVGMAGGPESSFQNSEFEAAVWQENESGEIEGKLLQDKLYLLGVNITEDGWTKLIRATDVSDDGNVIVGYGIQNGKVESFRVDLAAVPLPATSWLFFSAIAGLVGMRKIRTS